MPYQNLHLVPFGTFYHRRHRCFRPGHGRRLLRTHRRLHSRGPKLGVLRLAWRFPTDIKERLVTWTNPSGDVTNSDLEMAATVLHHDVIATGHGVREVTIGTLHDNTPAVFWNRKGSATTTGPAAYLLRLQALHARHHAYLPTHDFIPGHLNRMADDASRLLTDTDAGFLSHFNTQFPQPRPWRICTPRSAMSSAVILALRSTRCEPQSWTSEPVLQTINGHAGWISVTPSPWILGSPKGTTLYRTYKSSRKGTVMDASHPMDGPYDLAQLRTPCETSARRIDGWGPLIPDSTPTAP